MLNHMVYLNFEDNDRSFIMSHSKLFSVHQYMLCQINLHSYKELILILFKSFTHNWALVAHTYNPSYLGG
jgi:hypothetical protein